MPEIRHGRGQRTGPDHQIGQDEERARVVREDGFQRRMLPTRVYTYPEQPPTMTPWAITLVDQTAGAMTLALPPTTVGHGVVVAAKSVSTGGNPVVFTAPSGFTIGGLSSVSVTGTRLSRTFVADARRKEWLIM